MHAYDQGDPGDGELMGTNYYVDRLARDCPVPTGRCSRFGPNLAFLGSAGNDLSQGGSAWPLAPRMAPACRI
jgi:hypothetical protein